MTNLLDPQAIRQQRIAELTTAAEHEAVVARALDALADAIADAPLPVAQYAPVWGHIEARLRRSARAARQRSRQASERVGDVLDAIAARQHFDERKRT